MRAAAMTRPAAVQRTRRRPVDGGAIMTVGSCLRDESGESALGVLGRARGGFGRAPRAATRSSTASPEPGSFTAAGAAGNPPLGGMVFTSRPALSAFAAEGSAPCPGSPPDGEPEDPLDPELRRGGVFIPLHRSPSSGDGTLEMYSGIGANSTKLG
jgi:hypothetical protein